jgi:ADP-heptose:LPS heptosyltransferase
MTTGVRAVERILVIKLRALGDTILTTAALGELRKAYPQARITCLAPEIWASALHHHPAVDELWSFDTRLKGWKKLWASLKTLIQIRRNKFDLVLGLHVGGTAEFFCRWSGAPLRLAHNHDLLRPNRVSDRPIPNKGKVQPIIQRDLDVLRALGVQPTAEAKPTLALTHDERAWATRELEKLQAPGPYLALGLGASRSTKIWPADFFAELATRWCKETGGSALCFYGPNEVLMFQAIKDRAAANATQIVGISRKVRESMALMSTCRTFFGNDSGPKHMAAALKIPTVTIFGPEHPLEWHPYDVTQHKYFFIDNLSCRTISVNGQPAWCGLDVCVEQKHRCMHEITVDTVWPTVARDITTITVVERS